MRTQTVERGISGTIMSYFWPTALGFILQQGYALVDSMVVGRYLGKGALAAIGGTNLTMINLVLTMFAGLSTGSMVLISQQCGKGERDKVGRTIQNSMLISLIVGAIFLLVIQLSARGIHVLMKTPGEVLDDSVIYLRWYFIGMVPMLVFNMGSSVLRALGRANRPLVFLAICTVVNFLLDLLFVIVLKAGVRGAAAASGLSQLISAIMMVVSLTHLENGLSWKDWSLDRALVSRMLSIGLPAAVQNALYFISSLLMSYCVNRLGTDGVAAWAILFKFDSLFWALSSAFNISVTNVSGMYYGAHDMGKVRKTASRGVLCYLSVVIPFCAALLLTRGVSPYLFSSDQAVVRQASSILLYMSLSYPLFTFTEILGAVIKGTGETVKPTILTFISIVVLRVALVFTLTLRNTTNLTISLCYMIPWGVSSLLFSLLYLSGRWLPKSAEGEGR